MAKDTKREQPLELIIQRKGKTVFARLREDKEFTPAEVSGAVPFVAQFATLGQIKKELQDLMVAGEFRIVVPVTSLLAPEQAKVVVFGDMTGNSAAPVRPAPVAVASKRPAPSPARQAAEPAPKPAQLPAPKPAAATAPRPTSVAAPQPAASPKPAPTRAAAAPSAPAPAASPAPVTTPVAAPRPVAAPASKPRNGANLEEKAFKAFYDQWRAKNKIPRLPKHELEELRQGEWQEVKERFMAEWRK